MVGRMKLLISVKALFGLFGLLLWSGAHAQNPNSLPACLPEKQGVPSAAILSFVNRLEQEVDAVHSFMILRHGKRIAQGWWAPFEERPAIRRRRRYGPSFLQRRFLTRCRSEQLVLKATTLNCCCCFLCYFFGFESLHVILGTFQHLCKVIGAGHVRS